MGPSHEVRTGAGRPRTEHSSSEVCTQPDLSLRTQQAECFSRSRAARMRLCTCGSWRMQGENLAPRWMSASCRSGKSCCGLCPPQAPRIKAQPGPGLTELGPTQKFSCWTYLTFS